MLTGIALIASIICALTAVTTSLRAVGVAREYSDSSNTDVLKTGCRIGGDNTSHKPSQRSSLKLHAFVTAIWYSLSALSSVPYLREKVEIYGDSWKFIWGTSYILLALFIAIIWQMVVKNKNVS